MKTRDVQKFVTSTADAVRRGMADASKRPISTGVHTPAWQLNPSAHASVASQGAPSGSGSGFSHEPLTATKSSG